MLLSGDLTNVLPDVNKKRGSFTDASSQRKGIFKTELHSDANEVDEEEEETRKAKNVADARIKYDKIKAQELPPSVPLSRLMKTTLDNAQFSSEMSQKRFKKLFENPESQDLIKDAFWFILCDEFKGEFFTTLFDMIDANFSS